jgi:anti-anti-sigma factor
MAKTSIRLPSATPHAYLAWVSWWKDVEQLIGSDLAEHPVAPPSGTTDQATSSIVDEHLLLIEEEAKLAIEAGRNEMTPVLRAEPDQWNQWLRYGRMRREWFEALALKRLPDRGFPESLQTLWEGTMKVIQAVVSDHVVLHNVTLIPHDEPGLFLVQGELEVANIEAVADRLERELRAGHRLGIDLSAVKFIDSQGVRLLVRLSALAEELGLAPVTVYSPSEEVERVLSIAIPDGIPGLEIIEVA